jgi:hypothetical protein
LQSAATIQTQQNDGKKIKSKKANDLKGFERAVTKRLQMAAPHLDRSLAVLRLRLE